MHRFASLTAMVILIVAATASFPPVAAELKILEALSAEEVQAPGIEPPTDSAIEKRLGDFIDGAMAQQFAGNPLVGAVISIVHRGNVVLARAYGHADLEQNISADPEHSLIRPGSISKLFTWVSLLQLAEAGMVDLDADVNRYLEVFKIPKAFDKPVTLRHLMTHSPGFEDEIIEFIVVGSPDDFTSLEVALKNNIPKRLYKPGKVSAYSNYGSALAGYIVERATGVPFDTYIRRNILDPLGMPKATFKEPVPVGAGDHLMKPYYQAGGKFHIAPMEYIHNVAPAGALTTTANELARFMIALLNDGEFEEVDILPGDAGDQMLSRIFGHDPRVPGLAHGIYERWIKGVRALEHKGTTSFYKSDMLLIPQEQFGLFVSYNTPGGAGPRDQLLVAVVNEFFAQDYVPTAEAVPVPLALAETYSGTYRLNQYNATTFEKFLKFGTDIKVNVAESGEATVSSAG
ncbi:MAG: serine hydrolase, partial [Lacipirellulaceae bacterium]